MDDTVDPVEPAGLDEHGEPGWRTDPDDPSRQRWWDGASWVDASDEDDDEWHADLLRIAAQGAWTEPDDPEPAGPLQGPWFWVVLAVLMVLGFALGYLLAT